jgi:dCMP deaminase
MTDWDARWMNLAREIAAWSKDPSTKVGCVAVDDGRRLLAIGYNGFPRGVNDAAARYRDRPVKLLFIEHAERNLIYNAARCGVSLCESVLYCTFYPCADCARGIIQSGISGVVTTEPDWNRLGWRDSFDASLVMLGEAKIPVRFIKPVDEAPGVR